MLRFVAIKFNRIHWLSRTFVRKILHTKKEEILSKLLVLASQKGLRNLAMSEIASAAILKKTSLYAHFESRLVSFSQ